MKMFFDSDGTILNSIPSKNAAARLVFSQLFDGEQLDWVVDFFNKSKGSRSAKISQLTRLTGFKINEELFNEEFARELLSLVPSIEVRPGLEDLRQTHRDAKWYVVSNGSGPETQNIYRILGLDFLFDGGIWGSPQTKSALLSSFLSPNEGGWFFSDTEEDYVLASEFDLDFFYMSGWNSEKDNDFFMGRGIPALTSFY
jgi:phosphoglycolate phosphatase-like HAD superfamily hydrolase